MDKILDQSQLCYVMDKELVLKYEKLTYTGKSKKNPKNLDKIITAQLRMLLLTE